MDNLKVIAKKLLMDAIENDHLDLTLDEMDIDKILKKHDFDIDDIFYNALVDDLNYKLLNVWHECGI